MALKTVSSPSMLGLETIPQQPEARGLSEVGCGPFQVSKAKLPAANANRPIIAVAMLTLKRRVPGYLPVGPLYGIAALCLRGSATTGVDKAVVVCSAEAASTLSLISGQG